MSDELKSNRPDRFRIGGHECFPSSNSIRSPGGTTVSVTPKAMDVLVYLHEKAGQVVGKDELFKAIWPDTFVGDGALWNCISELRQALEEDPKSPRTIKTVPRRGYRIDLPAASSSPGPVPSRKKLAPSLIIASALLLAAAALWFSRDSASHGVSIPVSERPIILVAQIDNRTGDPNLDGTLEFALENELLSYSSLRIVSRTRMEETLVRMGRPARSPLSESIAREISLRDGDIAAIVSGTVSRFGSKYELGLRVLDAANGEVLLSSSKRVQEPDSLLDGLDDLGFEIANRVLSMGGLPSPPSTDRRVRTTSLEAFQTYLQGVEIYRRSQYSEAETLFRRAIEIDPSFASAHLMLGWSLRYQGLESEAIESGGRAMALRDRATPSEQEFIQGTVHYWKEEYEEAWGHFELLLKLEPDHPWAMMVLTTMAKRLQRFYRAAQLIQEAAADNPNLLILQTRGASILSEVLGRLDLAKPLIAQGRAIIASSKSFWSDETGWVGPWIRSVGIWEHWLNGDVTAALDEAERVRRWLEDERSQKLSFQRHANMLALQYLNLGRVKDARILLRDFGAGPGLYLPEMMLFSVAAQDGELVENFQQSPPGAARALVRLILSSNSPDGRTIELPAPSPTEPREGPIYTAGVAIQEGRLEDAIEELHYARKLIFEGRVVAPGYLNFAVPYMLRQSLVMFEIARLYEQLNQPVRAIQVLEELSTLRGQSYPATCIVWLFSQAYLADLYRREDREGEAREIETRLRHLLQFADEDHPLRLKLRF